LVEGLVSDTHDILKEIRLPRGDPAPLRDEVILRTKMLFISKKRLTIKRLADIGYIRPKAKRNNIEILAELQKKFDGLMGLMTIEY
jgi:hypothetical protein